MKWWQIVLWPLSFLYGGIMAVRNGMYNLGWFGSVSFDIPTIVVGNLEVGGSGKSPFVDYLVMNLKKDYDIGILSRGYGRNSKGFLFVNVDLEADLVGDESIMLKLKHPNVPVAVCENRVVGIKQMLKEYPHLDCIILDDAYQHRRLKAGYSVLLTQFLTPFYNDFVLPAGRLREFRSGKKRANAIVVTKTPLGISSDIQNEIIEKLKLDEHQSSYFAEYKQGELIQVFGQDSAPDKKAILVTGIAHSYGLKLELCKSYDILEHMAYTDHYKYNKASFFFLEKIRETKTIITTAKDWVKWQTYLTILKGWKIYVAPITVEVKKEEKLLKSLTTYIDLKKHGIRKG